MVKSHELEVTYASHFAGELIITWWHPVTRQRLTVVLKDFSSPFIVPEEIVSPGQARKEVTFLYPASVSLGEVIVASKAFTISSVPDAEVYFEHPCESVWPLGSTPHLLDHYLDYHRMAVGVDYFGARGMVGWQRT